MDFRLPEGLEPTLDAIRTLVHERVIPVERVAAEQGHVAAEAALVEVRAEVKRQGLWGPQIPVELGGMGLDLVSHGLVSEALGQTPYGHYSFGCQAPDAGNLEILHKYGTEAHRQRWLQPLARGEIRSCFSMTEPGTAGSNPVLLECRAVTDGDDYVINGRKWFTSAADGASFAIVMAVTNPDAPPHMRASQIIVPCDAPGFRLVRNIPIMGNPGGGWASHAEIAYEDCRVPRDNLLGEEGAGFLIAQQRLGPGRIHHCMRWLGICQRSFDLMCERAASRDMGSGVLAEKQIVRAWIAESRAEIDAARMMVLETAWTIENVGFAAARDKISLIKFHVAGVMQRVVDRAIQAHGALGITDDTPLAFFYAHERGARIYDGPDEVHKMSVAKRILKRYAK